jgi:hypothetical protein
MGKSKLEFFFDIYAENLSVVRHNTKNLVFEPDIEDIVICPICFDRYFSRESLFSRELTLEHVPPRSLGGSVRTFTCKNCNNWAGSKLESQLNRELEFIDFMAGIQGVSQNIFYQLNGSPVLTATFSIRDDNQWVLIGAPDRSNPRDLEQLRHILHSKPHDEWNFKLKFRPYRDRFPQAAQLRIGYLLAFGTLGYSFLMNPGLRVIRGQILHPQEKILPTWGIVRNNDLPDEALGINLVVQPAELQSFLVVYDLVTPQRTRSRVGVFLPGMTKPGLSIYSYLSKQSGTEIIFRTIPIPKDANFVDDPFLTYEMWNEWRLL